jgi:GNAT superfamily N-acetyltransferase
MALVIREAVLGDADAIARVSAASWRSSYRGILSEEVLAAIDVDKRAEKRREILHRGVGLHLVAEHDGELVGFCDAGPAREGAPGSGEVYAIYLLERMKRRRLGTELFGRARAWLAERELTTTSVWVLELNVAAREFYEALGGRATITKQITISGTALTEVAYVWD